ncbi:hypothetical protein [Umezawaea sp.]|uniref:hypothetical protein n=1 Tax=Umezawaea sp. TaxID=1955258 RepID=UPI002ED29FD0
MPGGFGFPLGAVLGVTATALAVTVGATGQPILSVLALVAVVDLIALLSSVGATLATAVVCWCLHAGFVLGRHGELAFTPQSRGDAAVLLLCALTGLALASTIRATRATVPEEEYDRNVLSIPVQRTSTAGRLVGNVPSA